MPKIAKLTKKSLIIISISLLIVVMLFCANYLSFLFLSQTSKSFIQLSSNTLSCYAISFEKGLTQSSAESLANDYRKIGAGGYVWQTDQYYYVLSSVYLNKSDALLVQNSIQQNHNLTSSIIEFQIPQISVSLNLDSEEKKVLQKALNAHENAYKQLFDIALSLDTNVYNEISARLAINTTFSSINTINADYRVLFEQIDELQTLTQSLQNLIETLQKLCSGITISSGQTMSSTIKYRYTQILDQARELSQTWNEN